MMSKKIKIKAISILFLALLFPFIIHAETEEKKQDNNDVQKLQLQQRIDFGNAYIMGQSIKSGAVYLLHRKKSDIDSMLKVRTDYRKEITEDFSLEDTKIIQKETDE